MSEKLTVRWEDPRIEDMAMRGMKEEGFKTLSDYIRAAIVRDRFLMGDKVAKEVVKDNFWKWWRGKIKQERLKLVME